MKEKKFKCEPISLLFCYFLHATSLCSCEFTEFFLLFVCLSVVISENVFHYDLNTENIKIVLFKLFVMFSWESIYPCKEETKSPRHQAFFFSADRIS